MAGKQHILSIGLSLAGLLIPALAHPARLVEGSFLATRDCPAYVSKAQETNPDAIKLVPGRIYPLFEINYDLQPDYYRIRIEEADPPERWVGAECGEYPPKSSLAQFAPPEPDPAVTTPQCQPAAPGVNACRTCGMAESYALALSWAPGYCETQREHLDEQPWCRNSDPNVYSARNFTLNEFWPVKRGCKQEYAYCGTVDHEMTPFSAYPALTLSGARREALDRIMPGVLAESGRERHEWHKYGSCTGFGEDAYFKLAGDLVEQFNQSGMADFMAENLGKKIRREDFFQRIESSLGKGARKHINIACSDKGDILVGVVINLPANIGLGADLKAMIQKAPRAGSTGNCDGRIRIDPAGIV